MIFSQLTAYLTMGLMSGLCFLLFLRVKRQVRVLDTQHLRQNEELRAKVRELVDELETVRQELQRIEQKSDPSATVGRALGSGVRIQALRMIKLGATPDNISTSLGVPKNEVELLVKVQKMTLSQPA